jgi:phosphoribosylglycinamide formyltransferase-1
MRIGVIASSGGSAFAAVAAACPHVDFHLVTDRPCGAEDRAAELGIPWTRVVDPSRDGFSAKAAGVLAGADAVVMLFSRLVAEPLLSAVPLLNIHPALLPAFPGMSAVPKAHEAGVRVLGATLHVADAGVDTGPVVAQAAQPVDPAAPLAHWEKLSFLHKSALVLVAVELLERGDLRVEGGRPVLRPGLGGDGRLNPTLRDPRYVGHLLALEAREGAAFLSA